MLFPPVVTMNRGKGFDFIYVFGDDIGRAGENTIWFSNRFVSNTTTEYKNVMIPWYLRL